MFFVKFHKREKTILAVCDVDVLGKVFRGGKVKIEVNEKFYAGEKADLKKVIQCMEAADIINIVGNKIVSELDKAGIISKEFAMDIGGVKHLQLLKNV